MMRLYNLLVAGFIALGMSCASSAAPSKTTPSPNDKLPAQAAQFPALRRLLQEPDEQINLLSAKLAIDQVIDPTVNAAAITREIDALTSSIKARFPPFATNQIKLELLVTSLSQPGTWNDFRPFSYDLNDPFGRDIHNKLLSTYLTTRKGNCVSMPILLIILGQELGLNITLATAPEHVLAKFQNDDGRWINIEATSFGVKRDTSYQHDLEISSQAMTSGIYLRPLSKRESIGVMLGSLMEFYGQQEQQDKRIAIADLALGANPKDVTAMLQKGNAYFRMMQKRYMARYRSPADIPPEEQQDFTMLSRNNDLWFSRAEALGWTMPNEVQNANYLQTIQRTKATHSGEK